jgi:hypothetical protein
MILLAKKDAMSDNSVVILHEAPIMWMLSLFDFNFDNFSCFLSVVKKTPYILINNHPLLIVITIKHHHLLVGNDIVFFRQITLTSKVYLNVVNTSFSF